MDTAIINTPLGKLRLNATDRGLTSVIFIDEPVEISRVIPKSLARTILQLSQYFDGKRSEFDISLDIEGTDFQKRVWSELINIPFGKTTSYLDMAKRLGNPKVIRAAANANGKNPIAIIIPCHRVIGIDGSLTGYAGGLHRKKWLLELESPLKQGMLF